MAEIEDRVHKLESTFNLLRGGAIVAAVLILGFFGFSSWVQIPRAVSNKVTEHITPTYKKKLEKFKSDAASAANAAKESAAAAKETANNLQKLLKKTRAQSSMLRIESGEIWFSARKNSPPGVRGTKNQRVKFKEQFLKVPQVVMALTYLDQDKNANLRVKAVVGQIDKTGFSYDLLTWADTIIYRAKFSWVAYGY